MSTETRKERVGGLNTDERVRTVGADMDTALKCIPESGRLKESRPSRVRPIQRGSTVYLKKSLR